MEESLGVKVSCSTIYRWLKREAWDHRCYLFEKGKKRRQRIMNRRGRIHCGAPSKRPIRSRPKGADNRTQRGHLEGDTVHSRKGRKGGVLTIRDRKNRMHWFEKVDDLTSDTVIRATVRILHRIPKDFRKTITFDRGSEFAGWEMIEKIFPKIKVYFCDPFSPHQKGSNERGNRDLRKFYPKGSDFSLVSCEDIVIPESPFVFNL